MSALTVTLPAPPPTDAKGGGNQRSAASPRSSQQELVTIEGMVDQIEVMHSLQKPKKVKYRVSGRRASPSRLAPSVNTAEAARRAAACCSFGSLPAWC
jgi:hypothetical protein